MQVYFLLSDVAIYCLSSFPPDLTYMLRYGSGFSTITNTTNIFFDELVCP